MIPTHPSLFLANALGNLPPPASEVRKREHFVGNQERWKCQTDSEGEQHFPSAQAFRIFKSKIRMHMNATHARRGVSVADDVPARIARSNEKNKVGLRVRTRSNHENETRKQHGMVVWMRVREGEA